MLSALKRKLCVNDNSHIAIQYIHVMIGNLLENTHVVCTACSCFLMKKIMLGYFLTIEKGSLVSRHLFSLYLFTNYFMFHTRTCTNEQS